MSHNKNYSKFSRRQDDVNLEESISNTNLVEENHVEENIVNEEMINNNIETTVENEPEQIREVNEEIHKTIIGVVTGCDLLRMRMKPTTESDEIALLGNSSEVIIDLDNSTEDFYKVKNVDGIEGYCMKKFINIK